MELVKFRNNWRGNTYNTMEINDFVNALDNCIEERKMYGDNENLDFYEYTGSSDDLVCMYFDYDEYVDRSVYAKLWRKCEDYEDDVMGYEDYEHSIKQTILDYLPPHAKYASMRNHREVVVTPDEGYIKCKFSYRLNFYNIVCYKSQLKKMVEHIKQKLHNIDTGVYDPHRKMRCVFTAKYDNIKYEKPSPMELVEGTTEQTLIHHYVNKEYDIFTYEDFCKLNNIKNEPIFKQPKTKSKQQIKQKNETNFSSTDTDTDTESISSDITNMDIDIVKNDVKNMNDIEKQLFILKHCFEKGQYNNWMKIGCILKKTLPYKEALEYFLSHSYVAPFDNEENKQKNINEHFNTWNTKNGYTKNSLMKMCKEENELLTLKLFPHLDFNGYMTIEELENNYELANKISKTITQSVAYTTTKKWYCLNEKNLWVNVNPSKNITQEVLRYIDYNIGYYAKKLNEVSSEEEKKSINSIIQIITKRRKAICNEVSPIKKIKEFLEGIIQDADFENKLDKKKNIMAFKNGVLCLETGNFNDGFKSDDYLTTHIPFEYNKNYDEEKIKNLKQNITQIMNNNEEHYSYLMSIIGACFTGQADKLKQFYFCVDGKDGIGNNGKTFLFDILTNMFPNYVYKTNKTFLEASNSKSHKQLANMGGKKIVWADEWSKAHPNYELFKTIADGNTEEYDVLFSSCGQLDILFKMFVLTNHTPNMSADEEAIYNRFRQITYGSHFDTQGLRTEPNIKELEFIADPTLPETIKNEYKNEMVAIILHFAKQFITNKYKLPEIPEKFLKDTAETKKTNDNLLTIINEEFVKNKDGKVSIHTLSSMCGKMDNKKMIKKMKDLGYEYKKDGRMRGETKRGIFIGLELKEEFEEEED